MNGIDAETAALLARYGFDQATFERLRRRLPADPTAGDANQIRGLLEPPRRQDIVRLPLGGSAEERVLAAIGRRALADGRVGTVVLAGGMATRFGGKVKAAVTVTDGRSFLDLKLAEVSRAARDAGGRVPVILMASFATFEEVRRLGDAASCPEAPVEVVTQSVSVRLTSTGEVFREPDGRASPYAPGHGDLTFALRASGALDRFRGAGGRHLFVSNVDNLAATLDPAVIGAHIEAGRPAAVELVRKEPGDVGGAPARVDGRLQIVEAFRFPLGFAQDGIPVFNTNTFVLDADGIDRDFPLTWFAVKKQVNGQEVVQFERLVGELTAFLPTTFVEVPRDGAASRFEGAKDPDELARRLPVIREILRARGVL